MEIALWVWDGERVVSERPTAKEELGYPVGELAAGLAPRWRCREHFAMLAVPRW